MRPGDGIRRLAVDPCGGSASNKEDLLWQIVDGMQMDVDETIRGAASFDKLGPLLRSRGQRRRAVVGPSVRAWTTHLGFANSPTISGRALQLKANILRDLDEDAEMGRLYLPAEALAQACIKTAEPGAVLVHPGVDRACRWVSYIAHDHYRVADAVLATRPAGRLRAPRLMSAVYGELLARMEAAGWEAPRARAKIGKGALLWIVLRRGLLG